MEPEPLTWRASLRREIRCRAGAPEQLTLDLARLSVREVNQLLHDADGGDFVVKNPRGLHAIAGGLDGDFNVTIDGHVGYYCAGMNKQALPSPSTAMPARGWPKT